MPLYAGIDIGIKNFSFCIIDPTRWLTYEAGESNDPGVVEWKNINIIGEPQKCQSTVKKGTALCQNKALWKMRANADWSYYCGRHRPEGAKKYTPPTIKTLGSHTLKKLLFLELDKYKIFDEVTYITIEMQPRKNPKMRMYCDCIESYFIIRKQIDKQILESIKTVHAKNKLTLYSGPIISTQHIKGAYAKRKYQSKKQTEYFLNRGQDTLNKYYFNNKKCDDLADSFLYCLWTIRNKQF